MNREHRYLTSNTVPNRSKNEIDTDTADMELERSKALFLSLGLSYDDAARAVGISKTAMYRSIKENKWPSAMRVKNDFVQWVVAQVKLAGLDSNSEPAISPPEKVLTEGEVEMLLQCQALTPQAKEVFGLSRSPFIDDVQCSDDVYQTPSVRYVRAAMLDAAKNHGFLAVVGESGSGKSTLAEDLEERLQNESKQIIVIRPYVQAMELNDAKGKTMRSLHIAEAICNALDPNVSVKRSPQARFNQLHNMLKASAKSGRSHLLLIEEAHCLPLATLKHLKRFLELKNGMKRLIGIVLIGQTELHETLDGKNMEVREVSQRCEVITLESITKELEGYLKLKFHRIGIDVNDVIAKDAYDAIRIRLVVQTTRGKSVDLCYPLVVNNLITRAMNEAAKLHFGVIDANVIGGL